MTVGHYNPAALAVAFATVDLANAQARAINMAMTPRQLQLTQWFGYFAAEEYDERVVQWNGMRVPGVRERSGLLRQTAVPPGYYDAGGLFDMVPLEHRKPEIAQHFPREVVWGFTDQLFGETSHPTLLVDKDDATTAWLADMTSSCSFWQRWGVSRNFAGAMGSAGMTFKFRDGRLIIEVHDPRWCTPKVTDQATGDCERLEIRYTYPLETRDEHGNVREVWQWYRRVIDTQDDTVYKPAPVDMKAEPTWEVDELATVHHGLGFFPGVWVQNTEAAGKPDGDPDCKGLFENSEAADRLLSAAVTGGGNNADPTLHVATSDTTLDAIRKGSKGAIRTEVGGTVDYVEHTGSGTDAALRIFEVVDKVNLRGARYVRLQDRDGGAMTAEEVKRRMGPMLNSIEHRRGHWSQTAIIPLTERIIRATRVVSSRVAVGPAGERLVTTVASPLPGSVTGGNLESRDLGTASLHVTVRWPPVIRSSPVDAQAAATAASVARGAKLLDRASAVTYIAGAFGIDDPATVLARLEEEDAQASAALQSELLAGTQPGQPGAPDPNVAAPAAEPAGSVQDTALNGAQMAQLAAFATLAFTGQLPRDAVLALARASLPMLPPELLEAGIPAPLPPAPAPAVDPVTGAPVPAGFPAPVAPPTAPPAPGPTPPAPAPGAPTP